MVTRARFGESKVSVLQSSRRSVGIFYVWRLAWSPAAFLNHPHPGGLIPLRLAMLHLHYRRALAPLGTQNQFEDASDEDDGSTTAASHSGGDGAKLPPKKANNTKGNKKKSSSINRAAASLFFSDTTAPRHRWVLNKSVPGGCYNGISRVTSF